MAVTVNGQGITVVEYQGELQRYQAGLQAAGQTVPAEGEQAAAVQQELIYQLLLAQAAGEYGCAQDDASLQTRLDGTISAVGGPDAFNTWLQQNFYDAATFQTAFKRNSAAACVRDALTAAVPATAPQVHARQIRVLSEASARGYLAQLQAGAAFDDLAAQVDPVTRGDLGWFPQGYLAQSAVDSAAFTLALGAYSDVITTEVGYHIIYIVEKEDAHPLTPDALLFVQQQAVENWLRGRQSAASVVITP
jgi:peptidyl-prolyl cis-trans isomerase C